MFPCSRQFDKEKISTDSDTRPDPVNFGWKNQRKQVAWERLEASAKRRMSSADVHFK